MNEENLAENSEINDEPPTSHGKSFLPVEGEPFPEITWDLGTAYDLFISLNVIHQPEKFGLRASWAAGVRSRVPADARQILEIAQDLFYIPFHWLYTIPEPKDANSVMLKLRQLPPERRLLALTLSPFYPHAAARILEEIAARKGWEEKDLEQLRQALRSEHYEPQRLRNLSRVLDAWSHAAEFGEAYLEALHAYHQAFFVEEERQILPVLEAELGKAQLLAQLLPTPLLFESLSQGVKLQGVFMQPKLVLIPSFWSSPLIYRQRISPDQLLVTFGARPANISLVPGDIVPEALLQGLKALADPTRLKILRYLSTGSMTPVQLSRRLRLRPPTVTHHLAVLRLAGLVSITLDERDSRLYTARAEMVSHLAEQIKSFLDHQE